MTEKLKIFVAYHNDNFPIFKSDIFEPIFCGKYYNQKDTSLICDNNGKNISEKNNIYSELTGHYWVLHNYLDRAKEEYIGFCHYRRFFDISSFTSSNDVGMYVLKYENLKLIFNDFKNIDYYNKLKIFDCILPTEDYFYSGGRTTPDKLKENQITCIEEMNITRKPDVLDAMIRTIEDNYPEMVPAMTRVFLRNYSHLYNMYIMKKDVLKEFLSWEFEVFEKIEKKTNYYNEGGYKREAGYFGEKMVDIWLEYKKEIKPDFNIGFSQIYTYDIVKENIERFKFFHSIKRYDLEVKTMEYLTTLVPKQAELYKILSNAYLSIKENEKALKALEKYSELKSENNNTKNKR